MFPPYGIWFLRKLWTFLPMEIERSAAGKLTDKAHDWRAEVGARNNADLPVDLARAREPGRGREANTPEQIPPRGWRDILWRVLWGISANRILSTAGGVAFLSLSPIRSFSFPARATRRWGPHSLPDW